MLLSGSAQVRDVRDGILTIAFTEGARKNFLQSGHDEILRQALIDELGVAWTVEAIIDESIGKGGRGASRDTGTSPAPRPVQPPSAAVSPVAAPSSPPDWAASAPAPGGAAGPDPSGIPTDGPSSTGDSAARNPAGAAAKQAIRKTRSGREPGGDQDDEPAAEIHDDDDVIDDAAVSGHELLARELGAEVIDDIRHDGP